MGQVIFIAEMLRFVNFMMFGNRLSVVIFVVQYATEWYQLVRTEGHSDRNDILDVTVKAGLKDSSSVTVLKEVYLHFDPLRMEKFWHSSFGLNLS